MADIRNGHYAAIPKAAARDPDVSDAEYRVLAILCEHANGDGTCWPAQGTIGKALDKSGQIVGRQIKRLVSAGYVEVVTKPRGPGTSYKYRIKFDLSKPHVSRDQTPGLTQDQTSEVSRDQTSEVSRGETSEVSVTTKRTTTLNNSATVTPIRTADKETAIRRLFEQFKTSYPSRGAHGNGYEAARLVFVQLAKAGENPEAIIRAAVNYAEYIRREGKPPQYVKTARRFLDEGVWREYVAPLPAEQARGSRAAI